jgi:hypothetical protein
MQPMPSLGLPHNVLLKLAGRVVGVKQLERARIAVQVSLRWMCPQLNSGR